MLNMSKNKKILLISSISLAVIIVLGIVYAAFTQQLNIAGSATGRSSKWDIHFENLSNVSLNGTAKELTAPTINTNNTQISNYSVSLTSPGDYVEYTFDVVNDGDYDATLTNLSKTAPSCQGTGDNASNDATNVCGKLTYTLTYENGATVSQSDTLKSKETKTMKLKLLYQEFNDDSLLPKMDVTISGLGIQLTYTQNGNAKVNADGTTPYVKTYAVGDQITVANETYHIISVPDSSDYVIALKDVPLKVTEITAAGGTVSYTYSDTNATGGMRYHTSSSAYGTSAIKSVVDSWASSKFTNSELKTVDGYSARLIRFDEYAANCEEVEHATPSGSYYTYTPNYVWMYSSDYWYWTMSPYNDSSSDVWNVLNGGGDLRGDYVNYSGDGAVRPVINVYKSKISS